MRNTGLFLTLCLFLISGCASYNTILPTELDGGAIYRVIDFRPFAEKGFLFTPEKPPQNYTSRGLVHVDLYPVVKQVTITEFKIFESDGEFTLDGVEYVVHKVIEYQGNTVANRYYAVSEVEIQEALEEMYLLAISMEADAVVNLSMSYDSSGNQGAPYTKIKVTGFAIRRD